MSLTRRALLPAAGLLLVVAPAAGAAGPAPAPAVVVHAAVDRAETLAGHERVGATARTSLGPLVAGPSAAVASDPVADDLPGLDPRGDLVALGVGFSGKDVEVGAATRRFESPTSLDWEGLALGNPNFIDGTGIEWRLDTNGDGTPDFSVFFAGNGTGVSADVTRTSDPTTTLCKARPSWSATTGYFATLAASCIGSPRHVRALAFMLYETPSDVSNDLTGFTATVTAPRPGYWLVTRAGSVSAFGAARDLGHAPTTTAVHLEPTPSRAGYWITDARGEVFSFGDARWFGNAGALPQGETVVSLSATRSGKGYWLVTSRGRVLPFGDARFLGDMSGGPLNAPVVGAAVTATGRGYLLVASDGGVFTFGDARFRGSTGAMHLNAPVVGIVRSGAAGYWLVASDGGVFSFGAPFLGSMGSTPLSRPVVGMVGYGNGYLMAAADGGVFDFADEPFVGSLGASPPAAPVVGLGATA